MFAHINKHAHVNTKDIITRIGPYVLNKCLHDGGMFFMTTTRKELCKSPSLCQPQRSHVMFTTISNFKAFSVLTDKSCLSTELASEDIIDCN